MLFKFKYLSEWTVGKIQRFVYVKARLLFACNRKMSKVTHVLPQVLCPVKQHGTLIYTYLDHAVSLTQNKNKHYHLLVMWAQKITSLCLGFLTTYMEIKRTVVKTKKGIILHDRLGAGLICCGVVLHTDQGTLLCLWISGGVIISRQESL